MAEDTVVFPNDGLAANSGNVNNKTQRITFATDDIPLNTINDSILSLLNNNISFASAETSVGPSGYTSLVSVSSGNYKYAGIEIASSASSTAPLSELIIQVKDHTSGEWYDLIGNDDWTDTNIPTLIFATSSPRPDQVDAGETAHIRLNIDKAWSFRVVAKTASLTALITVRGYAA